VSHTPAPKKPTVGFQAGFFPEGVERCNSLWENDLRIKNSRKIEKSRAKAAFFPSETPIFLQKHMIF
jgi:hypothetical protein